MEVSQFTYFQQVCGIECAPVSGELTYGLERLAMYVQGVDNVYDLNFNGREGDEKVTYGEVFLQAEQEYSRHNFEFANTEMLLRHFDDAEAECQALLAAGAPAANDNRAAAQDGPAGLRPGDQGEPCLQPARRARRDLGDRAAELYPARAQSRQGLRRGVPADAKPAASRPPDSARELRMPVRGVRGAVTSAGILAGPCAPATASGGSRLRRSVSACPCACSSSRRWSGSGRSVLGIACLADSDIVSSARRTPGILTSSDLLNAWQAGAEREKLEECRGRFHGRLSVDAFQ